jgi:cytochrome b subunit of formate dehydrogenase
MVRRFSRFSVITHWVIALPYLLLAVTGGLILLGRLGLFTRLSPPLLSALHRAAGIMLAALVVQVVYSALVTGRLRTLARDIAGWFLITPRDVLWLLMVPLNILWPRRFPLPRAGRYSAGQKLHGAFIVTAIAAFSATGAVMIFRPGELRAWLIHLWFFFGAMAFLALHLYLALINPTTRQALGGIFSGRVTRAYVAEHHPLDLPADHLHDAHDDAQAVVSLKALLITIAIAAVAAGVSLWEYEARPALARAAAVARTNHAMISPGPLAAAHARDPRTRQCASCHDRLGPPADQACLACHDEIARRIKSASGYHGQLTGECRTCHSDHRGADADIRNLDQRSFNHELARFRLVGKHQELHCDRCHLLPSGSDRRHRFVGLASGSCADCHDDPHRGQFDRSCAACHDESGWSGRQLAFDHARDARFKLDSLHSTLDCAQCHKRPRADAPVAYRPLPATCAECHADVAAAMAGTLAGRTAEPDPHHQRVSCVDCHSPEIRSPTPAQYASACQQCHGPAYRTVYFEWQKALDRRVSAAETALRRARESEPGSADSLSNVIEAARASGMHNLRLTTRVLEALPSHRPLKSPRPSVE